MRKRWILYLAVLVGGIIFYCAYQLWLAWLTLLAILLLPMAVLVLSLPAMIRIRIGYYPPRKTRAGQSLKVHMVPECFMPAPPLRCGLQVSRAVTGEKWHLKEGDPLPTEHCGQLVCRPEKAVAYDYLGLFHLRINRKTDAAITVWPEPVPVEDLPSLMQFMGKAWRPKPGGGFSEQHEMRLYRPGDKLNQIHWKLSAKTGKTMVREPMEPSTASVQVEMLLRGAPEEVNQKFGQLLWLSRYLLEKEIVYSLRVLTGNGIVLRQVADETMLEDAMQELLAAPCVTTGERMEPTDASWRYRIGGDWDAT